MKSDQDPRVLSALSAIILAATIIAFFPVVNNDFVHHDDGVYLIFNPVVPNGLTAEGVSWAFTTFHAGYWHPVTWLSHMFDAHLFGMDPAGHHAMSLAIHVINAIVLLLVLNQMTGSAWRSAAVALLFSLHPLRVESVAWASERKDLLSALFGLLAIWAYVVFARSPRMGHYLLAAVLFALSLMAKPMLVTLPLVLLLLDLWPLRRLEWRPLTASDADRGDFASGPFRGAPLGRLVFEKVPLLVLSAIFSAVTVIAQRQAGAMEDVPESIGSRIPNAMISCVRYIGKTFWPDNLAAFYPYPDRWPVWQVAGCALILLIITGGSIALARRRHRYVFTGWFWFVGTLVPVIGIVQVGHQSMADRFTYFPHIGLLIMVVWGGWALFKSAPKHAPVYAAAAVALIAAISLSVVTHAQTKRWRNSETLYRHALASTTNNYVMLHSLARVLATDGRDAEALEMWKEAARIRPNISVFQLELGEALLKVEDLSGAMQAYERALALRPDTVIALNNLAWLLATHPEAAKRDGRRALELAQQACDLTGNKHANNLSTLAAAYAETGNFPKAIETARQARTFATNDGLPSLAEIIDGHIRQFEASRPIRILP